MTPRCVEDVAVGDVLGPLELPVTLYRLVVAAGGNRDFNAIHHNRAVAVAGGAPDAYASTFFLMGTWERLVRDWLGDTGTIDRIEGFRLRRFTPVGTVTRIAGTVAEVGADGRVVLELTSRAGDEVTVGPGRVTVSLPRRGAP